MDNRSKWTAEIKAKAVELGFFLCGISKAEYLDEEARHLEQWLNQGFNGEMSYMANYFDLRTDPRLLVQGAKSVISLAYNYYNAEKPTDSTAPKVSMYAYGRDYHKVVKKKLLALFEYIKSFAGDIEGRVFTDSAPVMEGVWAQRGGIGWMGKHTIIINPKKGSHFFLGEIILDLELDYDQPMRDYCGTCTRCIDACPTEAIHPEGYILDGSRCISYLTIELKNSIPEEFKGKMEDWMFGCDICQQVCPWNRFSTPHNEPDFIPKTGLMTMTKEEWMELSEPLFEELFIGTPVKRTKYEGLTRNIRFLYDDEVKDHSSFEDIS
ncbi:MAG: tRNA epoxyqueuosine(34) reductase QueG [Saprospiraceae bacterium]|nr:MAG: iron-sulfur cluster binding protein [Bacteroidetes bacterium OLB9]MCO6462760.1 tRNA epoxyqueuosine(34) reductase QueG [Saprospiraceae bacterium]MCZ2339690.1 tRNA epoxyqueuosine(34) reductase QueG [Chitinophagales bacterium]